MWIQHCLSIFKARRERARWLKQERAARFELRHLNHHLRKDIGLTNLGSNPPLRWQQAPGSQNISKETPSSAANPQGTRRQPSPG